MSLKKIYLILACACFLVYANSLNGQFVSDDIDSIVNNKLISEPMTYWLFPSTLLSSLGYLLTKLNPFIYHLINIFLHTFATILVFLFLRLFLKKEASFLGALMFATLAIHTEAVTWISGRPYIMTTIFLLTGYFIYAYAVDSINPWAFACDDNLLPAMKFSAKDRRFRPWPYLACLLVFIYYLWHNFTFYFLFPLLLVISDLTFRSSRKTRRPWMPLAWLPFFAVVSFRLLTAKVLIDQRIASVAFDTGTAGANWSSPLQGFLYNMVYSLSRHLGLLIWPANLTLYHEPPIISIIQLWLGLIGLCVVAGFLPVIFKRSRELFFSILLFGIFLAPTFSPWMVSWLLAERYVYFPSLALCMTTGYFYEKFSGKNRRARDTALAVILFIIAANGARAVARNQDWKSPERLWRLTVVSSPDSPRAHNNMGDAFGREGNMEAALNEFKRSIELKPDYADGYHNLANTYHRLGNLTEAERHYKLAVTFNPNLAESFFNLGVIYLGRQELDPAIENFGKAAQLRPDDLEAQNALNFAIKKKSNFGDVP